MVDDKILEGVTYEVIPDPESEEWWHIRLLEEYPETVIRYNAIEIDTKDDQLKFDLTIIFTPDDEVTLDNLTFTNYCGIILGDVIEKSIREGSFAGLDKETNTLYASEEVEEYLNERGREILESS